jgi:hypothetical protein
MLQIPLNLSWKWPNYQKILKILMSHNFTNSKNKSWSWWRQIYRKLGSSKRVSTVPRMDSVKSSNYVLSRRSHKNDDWKPQHALDTRPNSVTRHFQHFTVQCNDLQKWCFYSFKDSTGLKFSPSNSQRTFTALKRSMKYFKIYLINPILSSNLLKKEPENLRRVISVIDASTGQL